MFLFSMLFICNNIIIDLNSVKIINKMEERKKERKKKKKEEEEEKERSKLKNNRLRTNPNHFLIW